MTDYRVVPAALRGAVAQIDEAVSSWIDAHASLKDQYTDGDTLGLLGRTKNVHDTYNRALTSVLQQLNEGAYRLDGAANSLHEVAKHYEALDADAYRQFGYIDEKLGY